MQIQNKVVDLSIIKHVENMTNEQILSAFKNLAETEAKKTTQIFEARMLELKSENKVARVAPKWNLKPSFSAHITDVTPEGYDN